MISATTLPRQPSFWMTALSLWVSGWVSSLFVGWWLPYRLAGTGLGLSLVSTSLAAAFIGGLVLRAILPRLAGVEISYLWAVLAIGLGRLAGNAFTVVVQAFTLRHLPASVAPALWSSPLLVLGATALRLVVSYRVIVLTAHAPSGWSRPAPERAGRVHDTDYGPGLAPLGGLAADLARTQDAVASTCIEISRAPAEAIPGRIVDALLELATCAHMLRREAPAEPQVRGAVDQLVRGLDKFQDALTQIADEAAATGTNRLFQRGVFSASMADVSDDGGRARYHLDHADGLAQIRDAFQQLRSLGLVPGE
jgi:hypothetical protein